MNGSSNYISAGDSARITLNGNSNTGDRPEFFRLLVLRFRHPGYGGTNGYMDFYGSNNYGGTKHRIHGPGVGRMGYGGFASGDRGWVGPSGMLIYADYDIHCGLR